MARTRRTQGGGTRTAGADPNGPPRLDLKVIDRLKFLALANILPLGALAIGIPAYLSGRISLRANAGEGLVPILILVGACVVLCLSCWMILPLGHWLRVRPRWHYDRGSKLVWFFPTVVGAIGGMLLKGIAVAAGIAALGGVGVGLVRLYEAWG